MSLFILLSGVTSYHSLERRFRERGRKETLRRLGAIFMPYVFATAVYQFLYYGVFNWDNFRENLLNFNAAGAFYFVLFYMELILAAPYLFMTVALINENKRKRALRAASLAAFALIAHALVKFTVVPGFYGGSSVALGGTYLFLFYAGMAFAGGAFRFRAKKSALAFALAFGAALFAYAAGVIYPGKISLDALARAPFGGGFNPPGINYMLYAALVGLFVFGAVSFAELTGSAFLRRVMRPFSFLGARSLYIFLYHNAVMNVFRNKLFPSAASFSVKTFPGLLLLACVLLVPAFGFEAYLKIKKRGAALLAAAEAAAGPK